MLFPRNKYTLMNPRHMIKRYEMQTGARYCTGCRAMAPLETFPRPQKYAPRHFICKIHHSNAVRNAPPAQAVKAKAAVEKEARPDRKAAMCLRAAARKDRLIFGHDAINLTTEETHDLLGKEHLERPTAFAIVPVNPMEPTSKTNAMLVSSAQRRYLTGMWKANRDSPAYERHMAALLNVGSPPPAEVI